MKNEKKWRNKRVRNDRLNSFMNSTRVLYLNKNIYVTRERDRQTEVKRLKVKR